MALPIRGLSTRSHRRGRSSSSERSSRSGRSSRWTRSRSQNGRSQSSRSRSSSRGRSDSQSERGSVLSGTSSMRSERTGRSSRWRKSTSDREKGRKKDALLKNYGNFLSRKSTGRTERTDVIEDGANCNRSQGSRRSRGSNRPGYDPSRPFLIPPDQALSPRSDIWFVLAITSCASISSFAQLTSDGGNGGPGDKLALSVCAICFAFSTICALGMRYAPFRTKFTSSSEGRARSLLQALMQGANVTPEMLVLFLMSALWLAGISMIVNGSVGQGQDITLAVTGTEIWNANLFYSSWLSALLTWYLLVEVLTLTDRNGVVPRYPGIPSKYRGWHSNCLTKRWSLLSLGSIIMLASSLRMYGGPNCAGILKSTDFCSRSLAGIVLGGIVQFLMCIGVCVIYRLSSMRNYSHVFSLEKKNKLTFGIGLISLLTQSVNVGLLTSPTGGGPGTSSGTVYFASWAGFIIVFEMVLRYVEFFSTYGADGSRIRETEPPRRSSSLEQSDYSRRGSRGNAPAPQEAVPMLPNSSRRGNRSTGTASTSDSEHERLEILQIQAAPVLALPPPPPSQQQKFRGPVSEASPSQLLHGGNSSQKEPHDAFSIGSVPKLEPEDSTSSGSKYEVRHREDAYSRASSKESGKTPEGYYLDNRAFGQQTSFHVDRMEELDQSKPSIHIGPRIPPSQSARRSKSPMEMSHRLASLSEVSNEKSSPSTHSPVSSRYTDIEGRPNSRPSSRQSSRPSSRNKKTATGSRASRHSNAPRSRDSRPNTHRSSPGSSDSHDPPPTISDDDLGTHTTASEYIARSKQISQHSSRQPSGHGSKKSVRSDSGSKASRGPPPPPFHRGIDMTPNSSGGSAIPLQSVNAYGNSAFDVSEPTIDVPENPLPTAQEMARLTMSMPMDYDIQESSTTNSYEYGKKWSDSTGAEKTIQRSSSDENPSSQGGSDEKDQVDDIVAAALAYAEKSHAGDGIRSTSSLAGKRPSAVHNESIHSFYSRSQGQSLSQATPDQGVDEMVARVLSQAGQQQAAQAQRALPRRMDSSMYSEYSQQSGMSSEFDGQFNC